MEAREGGRLRGRIGIDAGRMWVLGLSLEAENASGALHRRSGDVVHVRAKRTTEIVHDSLTNVIAVAQGIATDAGNMGADFTRPPSSTLISGATSLSSEWMRLHSNWTL